MSHMKDASDATEALAGDDDVLAEMQDAVLAGL